MYSSSKDTGKVYNVHVSVHLLLRDFGQLRCAFWAGNMLQGNTVFLEN
jgi:hypothetical protein